MLDNAPVLIVGYKSAESSLGTAPLTWIMQLGGFTYTTVSWNFLHQGLSATLNVKQGESLKGTS